MNLVFFSFQQFDSIFLQVLKKKTVLDVNLLWEFYRVSLHVPSCETAKSQSKPYVSQQNDETGRSEITKQEAVYVIAEIAENQSTWTCKN